MRKTFLKTLVATAVVGATVALSSAFAFAATYTLNANDLTAADITSETKAGTDNFFTLDASDSKKLTVDSSKKTGPTTGNKYTQRIKTNGASSGTDRTISFTLTKKANVTVEGLTGKNTEERYLGYTKDETFSSDNATTVLTSSTNDILANTVVLEPGTYYFGAWSASFSIYGIVVEEIDDDTATSATGLTKVSNGAVYVTDTDTYVIAGVSKDEVTTANGVTVTIGKTGVEAGSTVYENVVIDENTTITNSQVGADYIVAIKVAGANKNAKVESFTVKAE
jgi:hypothetical protein